MARANRTGVPGLSQIKSGPRAGRYMLGYRYICPVTRQPDLVTKLYPRELKTAAIKADAMGLIKDAHSGELYRRKAETKAAETKATIAELAPKVIAFREQDGGSAATLYEFRSLVAGVERPGRALKGGHIVRHLGAVAPHDVDSEKIAAFVDALKAEGLSALTIRNVLKVLGQFFRIVRVRKLDPDLRTNPLREAYEEGFKRPTQKRRDVPAFISLPAIEAVIGCKAIPADRRFRYALAFLTGLRDGELAALTWADVEIDDKGGEFVDVNKAYAKIGGLQSTKTTASERKVPLHPELVPWLRLWRAEGWAAVVGRDPKPDDPLLPKPPALPGLAAKVSRWRPDSARIIRKDLAAAHVVAPKGFNFHATRKSFATALEAAGVRAEIIERLLGHEPKTVLGRHYAAPTMEVLREAVSSLCLTSASRVRAVS